MTNRLGRDAALLSLTEIGLGSLLHSLHVPLSGHFLSLNQGLILSRATMATRPAAGARTCGLYISNIAAILKSLAPAGKKLTPMLAISAQGLLYSCGTLLFGANPFGIVCGMLLLALWAFVQPALLYFLIFGRTLLDVAGYYLDKLQEVFPVAYEGLAVALLAALAIKLLLAVAVGLLAIWLPPAVLERYFALLIRWSRRGRMRDFAPQAVSKRSAAWMAARDLTRPIFVMSLGLTVMFFVLSESSWATAVWGVLRPLAAGFVVFYLIRIGNFANLAARIERCGWPRLGKSLAKAVEVLKGI